MTIEAIIIIIMTMILFNRNNEDIHNHIMIT